VAVSVDLDIVGIKDALAQLNKLDRVARREITRDYKRIMESTVQEAQSRIPINAPISGFNRAWAPTNRIGVQTAGNILPWGQGINDTVVAGISAKRPKMFGGYLQNVATFFIRYKGPTSTLFDMSGKGPVPTPQGRRMVAGLSGRFGPPSRVLWPVVEANIDEIEYRVKQLVDRVMDYVNQGIGGAKERARERAAQKAA
jgi:hypothetical protein